MATVLDKFRAKGGLEIPGSASGLAQIVAPAAAGTPTLTLPTSSGTLELTGHTHTGSTISALDAADTTTGTFDIARIPTGSTGTTVSLGNHTHSYAPIDSPTFTGTVSADDLRSISEIMGAF